MNATAEQAFILSGEQDHNSESYLTQIKTTKSIGANVFLSHVPIDEVQNALGSSYRDETDLVDDKQVQLRQGTHRNQPCFFIFYGGTEYLFTPMKKG